VSDTQALPPPTARDFEAELHDWCAEMYANPLGWVRGAYPWGEHNGPLFAYQEPDVWQCEWFEWLGHEITTRQFDGVNPVMPIRGAVSSGHGIGKGAKVGMLVDFLMSTRRNAKGVITANTSTQLQDKTWAAIQTWTKRAITAHWFEINQNIMYRRGFRDQWKCSPQTCDPDNSEAFAGQHNVASTSFYINDEDSNVPNIIHEVQEGGLTDGEPMQFLYGNPTRRRGAFYDIVFGDSGKRWKTWIIDARNCRFPNKALIAEQLEDWGEDSDRFRVRVRGIAPKAEDAQFIDSQRVIDAQKRQVVVLDDEPLVAGCDLAWGGKDSNVIRFRRGRDARTIPAMRIPGELTRDPSVLTNRLADVLGSLHGGRKVAMLFLDSAGIAGTIGERLRVLGFQNVREINFGADSPRPKKTRYYRDFMWAEMKEWLIDAAIDKSPRLETDLTAPGLREDPQQRIWLESKKEMRARDVASPDDADALCWIAGTRVRTQHGWSAIETIGVGDSVWTPMGLRRVVCLHESETTSLTTVHFSNGRALCGKGAHRIFTKYTGFVRADALRLSCAVETDSVKERLAWWCWRQSCIAAKPFGFKAVAATINQHDVMGRSDFYIGASGLTRMGLFRLAAKSIISTMIGRIMTHRIFNCDFLASTNVHTCWCGIAIPYFAPVALPPWPWRSRKLQHGIEVQRDARGIVRMEKPRGVGAWRSVSHARDAQVSFSRIFRRGRGSVLAPANNVDAISASARTLGSVCTAVRRFWQTNIERTAIVVTAVQTQVVAPMKTYNLTVEHEHVYYANGVLVENCLTFAQKVAPVSTKPAPSMMVAHRSAWG